ncbi:conserved hypothetical protein [Ricinus communis]|uniref:Uncharacterized protein n=1 Tax=Ricinus communis TaxID=3988 RepID=B9SNJ6_RICCO|nr:conserved hypothetical protein [Ricinus communis]
MDCWKRIQCFWSRRWRTVIKGSRLKWWCLRVEQGGLDGQRSASIAKRNRVFLEAE